MLTAAAIVVVGCPAVWIDVRTHRIPNRLVLVTLLMACGIQVGLNGALGLAAALGGAMIGLAFLMPVHLMNAMGAGDVKLMAALAALLGPRTAILAGVLTLIAGAVLGLAVLTWTYRASSPSPEDGAVSALASRIPYAAAIVTGTLAAALLAD